MTDKEKLIALLIEWGVHFKQEQYGASNCIVVSGQGNDEAKVSGYCCFFTQYEFDENGKFKHMGAWE